MGFPRQADWIGLPCLPPGCLPDPGWTHVSCSSYTVGRSFTTYNSTLRTIICLVAQSCLTLCNPVDCRLPGSSVHGLSRQEYWLPFPSPGDLPIPGMELRAPALQVDSLQSESVWDYYINLIFPLHFTVRITANSLVFTSENINLQKQKKWNSAAISDSIKTDLVLLFFFLSFFNLCHPKFIFPYSSGNFHLQLWLRCSNSFFFGLGFQV